MTWLLLLVTVSGFGPAIEFTTEDRCEAARSAIIETITEGVIRRGAGRHRPEDRDAMDAQLMVERNFLALCIGIEK